MLAIDKNNSYIPIHDEYYFFKSSSG